MEFPNQSSPRVAVLHRLVLAGCCHWRSEGVETLWITFQLSLQGQSSIIVALWRISMLGNRRYSLSLCVGGLTARRVLASLFRRD